jgi:hypothetical protein
MYDHLSDDEVIVWGRFVRAMEQAMVDSLAHGFEPKHFILRPEECALLKAEGFISEYDGTLAFPAVPRRVGIEVSTSASSQLVSLARWIEVTTRLPSSKPPATHA